LSNGNIWMGFNPTDQLPLDGAFVADDRGGYGNALRHIVGSTVELGFPKARREKLSPFLVCAWVLGRHVPPIFPINVPDQFLNFVLQIAFPLTSFYSRVAS
jgi:hypothetical protein